jgi:pyruvate dehydrogenase kinase 2/3/4
MHATLVKHRTSAMLPSIRATIVAGENDVGIRISDEGMFKYFPQQCLWQIALQAGDSVRLKTPSDLFSFSHIRNATRLEDYRLGAQKECEQP